MILSISRLSIFYQKEKTDTDSLDNFNKIVTIKGFKIQDILFPDNQAAVDAIC
jgi:hypothetical protein